MAKNPPEIQPMMQRFNRGSPRLRLDSKSTLYNTEGMAMKRYPLIKRNENQEGADCPRRMFRLE